MLKDGARSVGKHRGGWFSSALVVFQFALTLVLLSGAGVFVHSLIVSLSANRSVPADQLMTARIDFPEDRYKDTDARQRFYDQLLPRLQALPGVTHVAITSNPPGMGSAESEVEIEHSAVDAKANRPQVAFVVQSPGYFDAIDLPMLLGRDFDETDGTADQKSAVVTRECAAHFWPNQSAIGKRFRFYDDKNKPGDWITVVGVVANITQDLDEKAPQAAALCAVPAGRLERHGACSSNLRLIPQLQCAARCRVLTGPAAAPCFACSPRPYIAGYGFSMLFRGFSQGLRGLRC